MILNIHSISGAADPVRYYLRFKVILSCSRSRPIWLDCAARHQGLRNVGCATARAVLSFSPILISYSTLYSIQCSVIGLRSSGLPGRIVLRLSTGRAVYVHGIHYSCIQFHISSAEAILPVLRSIFSIRHTCVVGWYLGSEKCLLFVPYR